MPRPRALAWPTRALATVALAALACAPGAAAASDPDLTDLGWVWPVSSFRIVEPYLQPAHRYAPGHRGVDLEPGDTTLRSPADGVIAFAGTIADRPVVTIDHGGGLVTTLEPVSTELPPGTPVHRGEPVGILGAGGHAPAGSFHFGVRLNGEYINPMLLLGGVPRAVLLPCCEPVAASEPDVRVRARRRRRCPGQRVQARG